MAVQLMLAIASLCQISAGAMNMSIDKIEEAQHKCHLYYADCLEKKKDFGICVKERTL